MTQPSETFRKIAFVVPSDHNADHYLRGVVQFASQQRNWLVHCFSWSPADERAQICRWTPDGVLCFDGSPDPGGLRASAELSELIAAPFVRLGPFPLDGPCVAADPVCVARLAFEHLTEIGFRRMAHASIVAQPWTKPVRAEFERLCKAAGLPVEAWNVPDERQPATVAEVPRPLQKRLASVTEPVGFLCVPDSIGQVVLQACRVIGDRRVKRTHFGAEIGPAW